MLQSTTFSPAIHHVLTTQKPSKKAHFLENPIKNTTTKKVANTRNH